MTDKIDVTECFADDSGKYKGQEKYRFWENFAKLRVDVWKNDCPKIYNYAKDYKSLPDPDVNSYDLYEAHIKVWNKRYEKFKDENIGNIKDIERHGRCRCEILMKDEEIILGSDSIMSIYWHRSYGNMPKVMKEICSCIEDKEKHKKYCPDIEEKDYKQFIENYLKKANTIGGFILFPRHECSINQARGIYDKIQDRFDLTLECIRRGYERGFEDNDPNNPLADVLKEDKRFFELFGSFKNYVDFFCLNSWVNDNYDNYEVKDLLSNDGNSLLPKDKWPQKILLCDFDGDERVKLWWNLYNNLMNRLDARNTDIQKLFWDKNK